MLAVAALLCMSLSAACTATAPAGLSAVATQPVGATPKDIPGVKNFARVSPILCRGAQPSSEGFAELKKLGIRTIVNFRSTHSDRDRLKGLGLRYVHVSSVANEVEEKEMVAFLKVLEDPANHPVFVHCRRGADRTGCAVATYRVVAEGWTAEGAIAEMRRFKFSELYRNIPRYLRNLEGQELREKVARAKPAKVDVVK